MKFKVVEKFISVNGEGKLTGQLAVFIRFAKCNLNCSFCDTKWANESDVTYEEMTAEEIYKYILETGIRNVTLTGGEPLLQNGIIELLELLEIDKNLYVEIETNGSIDLSIFSHLKNISFTMDYKLPGSEMEQFMIKDNLKILSKKDTLKFVAGSIEDLERAKYIIEQFNLIDKINIYLSPVFGKIQMESMVKFMEQYKMNGVTLQLQLHKVIWDPNMRGV